MKIVEHLNPYLSLNHKSVIDIGCKHGKDLFPFLDEGFTSLNGIDTDNSNKKHTYWEYIKCTSKMTFPINLEVSGDQRILQKYHPIQNMECELYFPQLVEEYNKSSIELNYGIDYDLRTFNFEKEYDVIIVSNILHFLNDSELRTVSDKIYDSLTDDGIVYVSVNTIDKCKSSGWVNGYERITRLQYGAKKNKYSDYYLFDSEKLNLLSEPYNKIIDLADDTRDKYANLFLLFK